MNIQVNSLKLQDNRLKFYTQNLNIEDNRLKINTQSLKLQDSRLKGHDAILNSLPILLNALPIKKISSCSNLLDEILNLDSAEPRRPVDIGDIDAIGFGRRGYRSVVCD
ncbi:hypothetical protein [Algoriphagus winogradskyi]|uniref:Uncharacterized protein n=1 Tax=Algoriphagus winogradskyi TaxID=237017 RepID=A0ABY1NBW1_9BACT|nr:hypothetical protein [Algoriphagus winogradskyi]SMP05214.1 hypothetical protein SAMN06265367_101331 [Algoriphagus winogradskyi]